MELGTKVKDYRSQVGVYPADYLFCTGTNGCIRFQCPPKLLALEETKIKQQLPEVGAAMYAPFTARLPLLYFLPLATGPLMEMR